MKALDYAIAAIAVIGFTPIIVVIIGNIRAAAKRRRRAARLDRFWDQL